AQFGDGHHSGVVDQDVQRAGEVADQLVDGAAVEQVEPGHRDGRVSGRGPDVAGGPLSGGEVAGGDDRLGAGRGQGTGRFHADTAGCPGDQGPAAVQVD